MTTCNDQSTNPWTEWTGLLARELPWLLGPRAPPRSRVSPSCSTELPRPSTCVATCPVPRAQCGSSCRLAMLPAAIDRASNAHGQAACEPLLLFWHGFTVPRYDLGKALQVLSATRDS